MERSQQEPWVQVLGQIAVRRPGREPAVLTGATRVLLAILVAAGAEGTTLEQIADAYWPTRRPSSWEIALRVSTSHLTTQLPEGWNVVRDADTLRLAPGDGFIDLWRIESELGSAIPAVDRPGWIDPGPPFAGIEGIALLDEAAARIGQILPTAGASHPDEINPFSAELPLNDRQSLALGTWVRNTRRAIVTATPERTAVVASAALGDSETTTRVVVGDRGLLLPLGPFAMAFPELRDELELEQGVIGADGAERAFRVVANAFSRRAGDGPQRLLIANAHELDKTSLKLASLLIDRAPLSDFAMLICADSGHRDIRWLDFMRRSVTAGCERIDADRNPAA